MQILDKGEEKEVGMNTYEYICGYELENCVGDMWFAVRERRG